MRGRIEVVSTGAQGMKLAVVLPRRTTPLPQPTVTFPHARGSRLRVLVVDDEPQVCRAIRDVLISEHDVEIAASGDSALDMIGATVYDVILCDVMMPRMNGRDVYERIRAKWPGLEQRVVFVTGGAFVPSLASFLESVDNVKLRKPFTLEQVLAAMRDAQTLEALVPAATSKFT
jgi:CheY-like chemotaxis protein